ncbi:hypothetical protein N2488_11635 [SAR92 clade bacterium H231]|nr:hypothetical protein [SAR92 clade bacterium H231]
MIEFIKEFQTIISAFIALMGASIVVLTTRTQINAVKKQKEDEKNNEIKGLAAILSVEAGMSLQSCGVIASMIYQNPIVKIDQDLYYRVYTEKLSSLHAFPSDLLHQVMYSYQKIMSLHELVKDRLEAVHEMGSSEKLPDNIAKSNISTVDLAASTMLELSILMPWLDHLVETGEVLSADEATGKVGQALNHLNPIAQELAAVKLNEIISKNEARAGNA